MANPSRPATFKGQGVERRCYGCGRGIKINEPGGLWFVEGPRPAVFARCCWHLAAGWHRRAAERSDGAEAA